MPDSLQPPTVLVVDDSTDSREMLAEFLRFRSFSVTTANDGQSAIAEARRVRPAIILMDLSLPGIDGWDATRVLKSDLLTRDIVIIAATAHAFPRERQRARDAGCDGFLTKPYDLRVLGDTLDAVFRRGISALSGT